MNIRGPKLRLSFSDKPMKCDCDYNIIAKLILSLLVISLFALTGVGYFYSTDTPSSSFLGILFGVGVVFSILIFKIDDKTHIPGMHDPLLTGHVFTPRSVYGPASTVYSSSLATRGSTTIQSSIKKDNNDNNRTEHEACADITV